MLNLMDTKFNSLITVYFLIERLKIVEYGLSAPFTYLVFKYG